jgi:hypothetical protein
MVTILPKGLNISILTLKPKMRQQGAMLLLYNPSPCPLPLFVLLREGGISKGGGEAPSL